MSESATSYLERKLQRILQREDDWEDSDLEIEEFSYFVTAKKAEVGPGTFEEFGIIPKDRIQNARSKYLKEKPTATKSEIVSTLVKTFYREPGIFDLKSSLTLSKCIRSRSDQFDEAKQYILNEGFSIVENEFLY